MNELREIVTSTGARLLVPRDLNARDASTIVGSTDWSITEWVNWAPSTEALREYIRLYKGNRYTQSYYHMARLLLQRRGERP